VTPRVLCRLLTGPRRGKRWQAATTVLRAPPPRPPRVGQRQRCRGVGQPNCRQREKGAVPRSMRSMWGGESPPESAGIRAGLSTSSCCSASGILSFIPRRFLGRTARIASGPGSPRTYTGKGLEAGVAGVDPRLRAAAHPIRGGRPPSPSCRPPNTRGSAPVSELPRTQCPGVGPRLRAAAHPVPRGRPHPRPRRQIAARGHDAISPG